MLNSRPADASGKLPGILVAGSVDLTAPVLEGLERISDIWNLRTSYDLLETKPL